MTIVIVIYYVTLLVFSFVYGRDRDGTSRLASGLGGVLLLLNLNWQVDRARYDLLRGTDDYSFGGMAMYVTTVLAISLALVTAFVWTGKKSRGRKVIGILNGYTPPAFDAGTVRSPDESNPVV